MTWIPTSVCLAELPPGSTLKVCPHETHTFVVKKHSKGITTFHNNVPGCPSVMYTESHRHVHLCSIGGVSDDYLNTLDLRDVDPKVAKLINVLWATRSIAIADAAHNSVLTITPANLQIHKRNHMQIKTQHNQAEMLKIIAERGLRAVEGQFPVAGEQDRFEWLPATTNRNPLTHPDTTWRARILPDIIRYEPRFTANSGYDSMHDALKSNPSANGVFEIRYSANGDFKSVSAIDK